MKKNSNILEYTVTELNKSIKNIIENSFLFIKVSGELSQVKVHSSGHIYFTLKDEDSSISGICWRSMVPKLRVKIEEGTSVSVKGRVTTYSPQSKYQLIVEQVEYKGEGSILKLLEDRKKKFAAEGLFDQEKKKRMPKYPVNLGVITSESGAVLRDIIHRVRDRFPLNIVLYPVKVQGESSAKEVCSGIDFFNKSIFSKQELKIDILIIARGGGSLEDLMPFNEEILVRKIFSSNIPIVSAIGHETDLTLCDFVADLRAPTPSAAIEMIIPDKNEISSRISDKQKALKKLMINLFEIIKTKMKYIDSKIPDVNLLINNYFQSIDVIYQRIETNIKKKILLKKNIFFQLSPKINQDAVKSYLDILKNKLTYTNKNLLKNTKIFVKERQIRFNLVIKQLNLVSYKETLRRGFAVVKKDRQIIRNNKETNLGDELEIEFFNDKSRVRKIR